MLLRFNRLAVTGKYARTVETHMTRRPVLFAITYTYFYWRNRHAFIQPAIAITTNCHTLFTTVSHFQKFAHNRIFWRRTKKILRSIHKCVSCTYLPSYFDMQCQWHGRVEAGWGRAIWMHGYKILQMAIIQLFHPHNISDSASGWDISLVSILWLTFGWDENELQEKETWIR